MTITEFTEKLKNTPESITFQETMEVIETYYDFEPTSFSNGKVENQAGQNSGSCKLFAFGMLQNFNKEETLACFGSYYHEDVLKKPKGDDHQNIRNFIKTGWEGISFKKPALVKKQS